MTTFGQYTFTRIGESEIYSKMHFFLLLTAHVQVLPFVRVATKMNEEGERATLENSWILLSWSFCSMKRILFMRLIGNHTLSCAI